MDSDLIGGGAGRPVLLGATEGLEFVDAPGHAADLARHRAQGYAMRGNRIRIATDRSMDAVEVPPLSTNSVEMAGVTVEYCPPRPLPAARLGETVGCGHPRTRDPIIPMRTQLRPTLTVALTVSALIPAQEGVLLPILPGTFL
jgi:hypothetical protein